MWLISDIGFFSVVQKNNESLLTVRARTEIDLDRLRADYLPELGPTQTEGGTDYPFRARVERESFARAAGRLVRDIHYPNFEGHVAEIDGKPRAGIYSNVWTALKKLQGPKKPAEAPRLRYGAVVFSPEGALLLYKPKNAFGGTHQFPKSECHENQSGFMAAQFGAAKKLGVGGLYRFTDFPGWHRTRSSRSHFWGFVGLERRKVDHEHVDEVIEAEPVHAAPPLEEHKGAEAARRDETLVKQAQILAPRIRQAFRRLPNARFRCHDLSVASAVALATQPDTIVARREREWAKLNLVTGALELLRTALEVDGHPKRPTHLSGPGWDYLLGLEQQAIRLSSRGEERKTYSHAELLGAAQSPNGRYLAKTDDPYSADPLLIAEVDWKQDEPDTLRTDFRPARGRWHAAQTSGFSWSQDSRFLVEANAGTCINVYDTETGETVAVPIYPEGHPMGVATHPHYPLTVVSSRGLALVDLERRRTIWTRYHHDDDWDRRASFSPCGRYIVYVSCGHLVAEPLDDSPPRFWKLENHRESPQFFGNTMLLQTGTGVAAYNWEELT